jgi:hypothetical protein
MSKDYERLSESSEAFIYTAMSRVDGEEIGPFMRLFRQLQGKLRIRKRALSSSSSS